MVRFFLYPTPRVGVALYMTILGLAVFITILAFSTGGACYGWALLMDGLLRPNHGDDVRNSRLWLTLALTFIGWALIIIGVGWAVGLSMAAFA